MSRFLVDEIAIKSSHRRDGFVVDVSALVAQALSEAMALITTDERLAAYPGTIERV